MQSIEKKATISLDQIQFNPSYHQISYSVDGPVVGVMHRP